MKKKIIAYQGVQGAYSHLACKNVFPNSTSIACETFQEAMHLVEINQADFAMIPVENSTAGRVEEIYRLIPKMELHIWNEHFEPVKHCLLAIRGTKLENIKYVSSHPQALAQCHNNIATYNLEAIAKFDTAGAAEELIHMDDTSHAAIASSLASKLYDLQILNDYFCDFTINTTRFLILSKNTALSKYAKVVSSLTSLVFSVRNILSSFYTALFCIFTNCLNLINK